MKNRVLSQSATVLLTAALLQACGGGGGDSTPAPVANTAPTNVSLVEVSSAGSTVVTASWLPATDDSTPAANLNYEIHASTDPNFVPSASTLKLKGASLASARIDGLLPSTQYTLKLVVLDKDGLKTVSNSLQVTTSSTPSEQMAGVTVKTIAAGQTLAMTDTSLTLAAGAPVPNVGEFVASAEGEGYLRKVVAVNVVDGKTVLTTEQAALNEVLQKAELSSSFKIKSVPVEVVATPTQAGLMRVNDVTQPDRANFDWGNTGFKLNTTTYKADTNTPNQALMQAGLESVSASPSFSASSQQNTFRDTWTTNKYASVSVPVSVSVAKKGSGTFNAVQKIEHDDEEGYYWDRKRVPLTLCDNELVKVVDENGDAVTGLVTLGAFESVQSEVAVDSVRVANQVINVNASSAKVSEKPYVAVLKAHVDEARDGCKSPSKETVEYNVDIYVTSANDFPQEETSALSFEGDFHVKNELTYTIDPVIESEVRLDNNLGPDTLSYARLELKTAPQVHQVLTIDANASGTLDKTQTLFTRKFTKVYLAGSVPVVMVGEYGVDVRIDGNVTGEMNATEAMDIGFSELSYGFVYQNGQYTAISKKTPTYSLKIDGEAKASANLKVSLIPRLTVKFYGIATGKAFVEPYGLAEAGINGHIHATVSDAGEYADTDYQLTQAQLSVGVDAYLYADLSIFKKTLISFPKGKNQDTPYRELYKVELLPNAKIMALPTLSAEMMTAPPLVENSRSLLVHAKAENLPNPLTFLARGSKPWIEFANWTKPKVVFDAPNTLDTNGYKLVASDTTAGDFWFTYTQTGKYILRLSGYSSLGVWARQYTEVVVELTDTDKDGMIDQWEEAFGVTDPNDDPDGDGRTNLEEFKAGTNPIVKDNELTAVDTDKDGMSDAWEWRYGLNPYSDTDAIQDPDGDKITNVNEYKAGTNPKLADANALLKVSNATPTVNTAVSFSLATVFDSVKSIVWKFGETVVTVVENLAAAISQMFNTTGDVAVSATLKDSTGVEITTVSTTVSVKPLVCSNGQVEQGGKCVSTTTPPIYEKPETLTFDGIKDVVQENVLALNKDFGAFTASTMVYFDSIDPDVYGKEWKAIFTKRYAGQSFGLMMFMGRSTSCADGLCPANNGHVLRVYAQGLSTNSADYVWTDIQAKRWYHVAYTYDGANIKIYVDGILKITQPSTGTITGNSQALNLGRNDGTYPYYLGGQLKQLKIYDRALSQVEIASLSAYSGTFTVPATSEGVPFNSPSSTKPLQCSFTATGLASEAAKTPYIGPNGRVLDAPNFPMPGKPLMALITKHGDASYELVGASATIGVKQNETLLFLTNDNRWDDNRGQFDVTYTCSEIPQPTWTTNPANSHQYATADCGTWTQCEAQAVALGAHLVSVNDAVEQSWLLSTFNQPKNYWIGLTDKDQEGIWKWTSGEAFEYSNWYSNLGGSEPNNSLGVENYVHMNLYGYGVKYGGTGQWNDTLNDIVGTPYFSPVPAIGLFERPAQPTWTINPANGHQYAAVDCGTWTQCEAQAVALGAHLVSVNDAAENAWLVSTFTPTKNYWIGLTDKDQEGVWKWTSGEAFGYSNWVTGEPNNGFGGTANESYVHMNFNYPSRTNLIGKWNDTQNDITGTGIGGIPYNSSAMGIFEKSSSDAFYDTFDGSTLNTNDWVSTAGTGPIVVTASEVTFGAGSSASTQGNKTFSGSKIVIRSRFAGKKASGRDTHFELVDTQSGDTIRISDTTYSGWGLNIQATGAFNLTGANNSRGVPTGGLNIETNGISTSAYKYVRATIDSTSIIVERGDSADQITERLERNLGTSISGRTFYLRVGTGSNDGVYSPGTFDWISVSNQ